MDDRVVEDFRRPVPRRGLGRGLGAILPARGMPVAPRHAEDAEAPVDPLTGLARRARLLERLEEALQEARNDGSTLVLVVFGLDRFRHLNAEFGHDVGDAVLHDLGERLARARRTSDTVARLSGDEFAVVCPGADARASGERLVARLKSEVERPVVVAGVTHRLRATLGVVVTEAGGCSSSARTLLRQADLAMHRAKDDGVPWALFDPVPVVASVPPPAVLEPAVRYRPVVDLRSGLLAGGWALAEGGTEAEPVEVGLHAVLRRVHTDLGAWARTVGLGAGLRLWVDVPAAALAEPGVLGSVEQVLAGGGVGPDAFGLVLRTVGLWPDAARSDGLRRLAAAGVAVAVDPSNVGSAALAQLLALPVSALVVPPGLASTVVAAAAGPATVATATVARALTGLGRELGLDVIADGADGDGAALALRAIGCTHASGPLYGAPCTPERFEAVLRAAAAC